MHQKEVLNHVTNYTKTGVIHDALIRFFDQNGKWRGDTIRWRCANAKGLQAALKSCMLPPSRRVRRDRSGTVLRTSFYWTGPECVRMNYSGIEGSFICVSKVPIYAANLRHVGGHFATSTNHRIYLPYLASVGRNFDASKSFFLNAPRLRQVGGRAIFAAQVPPSLETVGGKLGAIWAYTFEAPKLKHVGGTMVLTKTEVLQVPVLETVGGGILLGPLAKKIDAPKLRSVGGDFLAGLVTHIRASRLRSVGGDLVTWRASDFYHPAIRVGGRWTIHPNAMENWIRREMVRQAIRGNGEPLFL